MYEKEAIVSSTKVIKKDCKDLKQYIADGKSKDILLNVVESIIAWNKRIEEAVQ